MKASVSSHIRNGLLALAAVFLCAGALELFFRTTHFLGARISWSVPDPVLGWRYRAGRSFWSFDENDHPIRWSTNRFGWKDEEWPIARKPGVARIALLGDSYVESMQVEPRRHFENLLERRLREKGRPVEMFNFGRAGFSQAEELWVLQHEILRFSPDAVVLFFFPPNDIDEIAPETSSDLIGRSSAGPKAGSSGSTRRSTGRVRMRSKS